MYTRPFPARPAPSLRLFRWLMAGLIPVLTASLAVAAVSHDLKSFVEPGGTGYIIDSDAQNANLFYNRDAITSRVNVEYTRSGVSDFHYEYRFNFQLINEAGVAQTLVLPNNGTGTTLTVLDEVNMNAVPGPTTRDIDGRVIPANRLDPSQNYRVRVKISRRVFVNFSVFGTILTTADTPARKYKHFNQSDSGDAPYNIISEVSSITWDRTSRVRTDGNNDYFRVSATVGLYRYDSFSSPAPTEDVISTRLTVVMRDDLGAIVPLTQSVFNFQHNTATFSEAIGFFPRSPAANNTIRIFDLKPVNQLLSFSRRYNVQITAAHIETPGGVDFTSGGSGTGADVALLDFNGSLLTNGVAASFSSIANVPQIDSLGADHVVSTLNINNQSGIFQGMTFGNGSALGVQLFDTGVAHLTSGTLNLGGTGFPINPGVIDYTLQNVVVSPTGITGQVNLRLPSGLGVAADSLTRIHESQIVFSNVALTSQLKPAVATLTSSGTRWAAEETKPFVFESSALHWDVVPDRIRFTATGNARFVRGDAYDTLNNDGVIPYSQRSKFSNDGYYHNLNSVTSGEVIVSADGAMTCDVAMSGASYRGHFPQGMWVTTTAGAQRIVADKIDPTFGGLTTDGSVRLSYRRDCPSGACGTPVGTEELLFNPTDEHLAFTRDGGVAASGALAAPKNIDWGWVSSGNYFAHSARNFSVAGFHASGNFLAASEAAGNQPETLPARLLLTGVSPSAPNTVERPGTNAYKAGLGDYAGLNFRVIDWGDKNGKIILAGQTSPEFPLTNRAKYYVRASGVTGIHEAVNGQFAPTAIIYGMDFEFTTLGWAFRDGEDVTSRTDGNLTVQYPSDFNLEFEKVRLTCQGGLLSADISATDVGSMKKLSYWNADFRPLTLSFQGPDAQNCDPSSRSLVLGVETYAGGIPQPLTGTIGFQENGNLITLASNELPDFDSRFRLPNNFSIAGPNNQVYAATPVGEAYLNDYAALPAGPGWMNLAAFLNVPFFSDMEVHLHTTAVKDDATALYHIMGGAPASGFTNNGKHFFNETIYDQSNRGFPPSGTLAQYRDGSTEDYRPVARKKWLNVIDLAYPLKWRPSSRSFASYADVTNKFLVLNAAHRVDYLSAEFAEVTFGASASLVPKISIANFVADKATDVTAVLQEKLQTHVVDAGIQGLNDILDVKQREFFEKALSPAVDVTVDAIMDSINGHWLANSKKWKDTNFMPVINTGLLDNTLGVTAQISEKLTDATGVIKEIDDRLKLADDTLVTIEAFIQKKDGQTLGDLQTTVVNLASLVSSALEKPEFGEKIKALMERAEPRVVEIRLAIAEVRKYIGEVRTALGAAGDFTAEINDLVADNGASMTSGAVLVGKDIEKILKGVKTGVDSLPQLEATIRKKIKQRINDYMLGLPVIAQFNRLIKQRIYDASAQMTEAIDEVFDQLNLTLRDVIREVAGGLDDKFEEMLGDVGGTMATADINGYAKIRNDSLTDLRLDLKAKLSVPDEMKAHVYLVIRELSSENSAAECLPATGKATEVTMGAKDIAVEWIFPGTIISIHSKFILNTSSPGSKFLGMGGGFDLTGEITFGEQVKIKQLGASVMFSHDEAYLSAAAKIEVQGFAGGGGIFLGRACSVDPFFWDPTVASVLGEPPFTGMYGYGEFWIPIPTLIGIPSTCLFNLSAGVGAGAGFFLEGPTVFGKMFLGVSGDVLCIVSVTGEISLVGLARPSGLALAGDGRFAVALGWCPICLKFDKKIRLTREGGKWSRSVK